MKQKITIAQSYAFQLNSEAINSANASFQCGIGESPFSFRRLFSKRELAGRGAGRGNSFVVQGCICCVL